MNYFAHALPFLDQDPYLVAGTATPDWLTVADRKVRLRLKRVTAFFHDPDPRVAAVARGAAQHLCDDAAFHATRAFAELSWQFTAQSRDVLGDEAGLRPAFLGHLLVEVLLDAALTADNLAALETYYRRLDEVDAERIQGAVNRMATQPTTRLAMMISHFRRERILWDYFDDGKLMLRLNQVMRRVGLEELPEAFAQILPAARRAVSARAAELLRGIPAVVSG